MVEKPDNEGIFAWVRNPSKQGSIFQHSLVVIVPLAILASIALVFGFIFAGDNSGARVRMIEASLAVIGGAGAAVALVVNYRRQQVLLRNRITELQTRKHSIETKSWQGVI